MKTRHCPKRGREAPASENYCTMCGLELEATPCGSSTTYRAHNATGNGGDLE